MLLLTYKLKCEWEQVVCSAVVLELVDQPSCNDWHWQIWFYTPHGVFLFLLHQICWKKLRALNSLQDSLVQLIDSQQRLVGNAVYCDFSENKDLIVTVMEDSPENCGWINMKFVTEVRAGPIANWLTVGVNPVLGLGMNWGDFDSPGILK